MGNIEKELELIAKRPYVMYMGAKTVAKRFDVDEFAFRRARMICRKQLGTAYPENVTKAKILLLDIETAPMRGFVWKRWKENVGLDQTISEWFMICWAAKWLDEDRVYGGCNTYAEMITEDDSRICTELWDLLDEAEIIITHNGKKFDEPKIRTRMLINGLPPLTPYKQIDTKEIAQKQFGFSSNKLDALAIQFKFKRKIETNFNLWKECMYGNEEALADMAEYNKYDVLLLEQVYKKLRPWIKNHPNLGMYDHSLEELCAHCGSDLLEEIEDRYYYTHNGKYQTFRCMNCGSVLRRRASVKDKMKKVVSSIPGV